MRNKKCLGPYDLFVLKYDLVLGLQPEPAGEPASLTMETFEAGIQLIEEFAAKEYGRVLPEDYTEPVIASRYEHMWKKLIAGHEEYFRKRKYLPVAYHHSTEEFIVDISRGRPMVETRKDHKVDLRLGNEIINQLDNYCKTNNIKRSEAVRQALELLLKPNPEKAE